MKKLFTFILCAMAMFVARAQIAVDDLTIVGETSFTIEQEPRFDWSSTLYEIPVDGIAELLGVERSYLADNFVQMFCGQVWDQGNFAFNIIDNGNEVDVPAGFYYCKGNILDDKGNESPVRIAYRGYLGETLFFFHKGAYDAANDVILLGCGQSTNPDRIGKHEVNSYIVNGTKAYVIHFNISFEAPEQQGIESMKSVGSEEWLMENRDFRKGWNDLDSLVLDMGAILGKFAEEMGRDVAADELVFMAVNEYDGITNIYTADNDDFWKGFWFSAETGQAQAYSGTPSFFVNYALNDGMFYVGNMPGVFSGGEAMSTTLYLVAEDKYYYAIDFIMTMGAPNFTLENCEMQEMNMVVQLVPSTDGAWDVRHLDVAYIENMLGASDLMFYGVTADGAITTNYSVSEAANGGGGFWMSPLDENGWAHAAGYTGSGAFAIWYTGQGEMWFFNQPGLPQIGDKVKATFYMANLWDGQAVKINMTVRYVEEIKEVEPLGTESIELTAAPKFTETVMDFTGCAETFGVDASEIKDCAKMAIINTDGDLTTEGVSIDGIDNVFTFNADGEQVAYDDGAAAFCLALVDGVLYAKEVVAVPTFYAEGNWPHDYHATVYLIYEEEESGEQLIYAYDVTVHSTAIGDAISAPAATVDAQVYDIAGRRVAQPVKGLCIKSGKIFMVK